MNYKITFVVIMVAMLLSSCATYYTYRESTARFIEPVRAGFVTPVVADMKIEQQKISYTKKFENTLKPKDIILIKSDMYSGRESGTVLMWKKSTLAEALKQHNADDIVTPTFDIEPSADYKYIEVTVTGYPATYVNYRKATQEDVNLMLPFIEGKKTVETENVLYINRSKL
ncbi:MAG: hypothetical protein J5709_03445 [Bacteroidales bacterium]|nr:hypothetical protein [Bacteroidales bacterium]